MARFHRGCAMITVVLLVPATGWAQAEHRPGTTSLRAASNAARIESDARQSAGPHPTARMTAEREAAHGWARQNTGQSKPRRDSVANGIAIGALTGALGGAALTATMYAQCNGTCDARAVPEVLFPTMGLFAGVAAWSVSLIDRAR